MVPASDSERVKSSLRTSTALAGWSSSIGCSAAKHAFRYLSIVLPAAEMHLKLATFAASIATLRHAVVTCGVTALHERFVATKFSTQSPMYTTICSTVTAPTDLRSPDP